MNRTHLVPAAWVAVAACALALVSGGSYAKGAYDAKNADKVDGFHAVGSKASKAKRAGKLVATDKAGRVPDSARVGGFNHAKLATINIAPQAAYLTGSASMSASGPVLAAAGNSTMVVSFVLPPDRNPTGGKLRMDVVYQESSAGACSWYSFGQGLEGPDGGQNVSNVHNGGWQPPGLSGYSGAVEVPAGAGTAQRARFTWPFQADPGMFIQFSLTRQGDDAADTCGAVTVSGLMLHY
jgi:hypothetical protein